MAGKAGSDHGAAQIQELHQPAGDHTAVALRQDANLGHPGANVAVADMRSGGDNAVHPAIAGGPGHDCHIVGDGQTQAAAAKPGAGTAAADAGGTDTTTTDKTTRTENYYASGTKQVESTLGNDTRWSVSAQGQPSTEVSQTTSHADGPAAVATNDSATPVVQPSTEQMAKADDKLFNPHLQPQQQEVDQHANA